VTLRLIFDLDETLIDSVPSLCAAANVMLGELNRDPVTPQQYKGFVGHGMRQQIIRALTATGGVPDDDVTPYLDRMMEIYSADPISGVTVFPNVINTLNDLSNSGHQMAVCTQKPADQARTILQRLQLMPPITGLTGGETLSVLKPDPAMLHHAAAQLSGDDPILMVGDRDVDAQTAANAGARFVLFSPEGTQPDFHTDGLISDWSQLPALLTTLHAHAA